MLDGVFIIDADADADAGVWLAGGVGGTTNWYGVQDVAQKSSEKKQSSNLHITYLNCNIGYSNPLSRRPGARQ